METRKESLSALKLCRFCLCQDESLFSLYKKRKSKNVPLSLKIMSCISVEVFPSDKMPSYICSPCAKFMGLFYEYKQICRKADETILHFIQKGANLDSIPWPASLLKVINSDETTRINSEVKVVNTVVEGGATIQVCQDASDSEEEDDTNIYNVKIADGSEEGSKAACVKVITSKEKPDTSQGHSKSNPKGFMSVSKLTRHVRSHAGERPYPCKYCSKSFMKSHHYTRHLRLKHRHMSNSARGPFGEPEQYRCEQCDESFASQDDLIYHSAIHATQNLTCPLCQEKFENVDAVTVHIKSHVNGTDFMCDYCELLFTSKEKLDNHISNKHDDEARSGNEFGQDDESLEMDGEEDDEDDDDDDDNAINVQVEDDHMVVEIKKADEFMRPTQRMHDMKHEINSEESDPEATYTELSTVDTLTIVRKDNKTVVQKSPVKPVTMATVGKVLTPIAASTPVTKAADNTESQTASILRKAEEVKRKVVQQQTTNQESNSVSDKKSTIKTNVAAPVQTTTGTNDKTLRLLEKELQELKRTNTRNEAAKTATKPVENVRNRRPPIHVTKARPEEKKMPVPSKSPVVEKKLMERRIVTKENKEPKDTKETKNNNTNLKEDKEKEPPKSIIKNGANDKNASDENIRRSSRPSRVKDYAKMIRDGSQDTDDDSDDSGDEEYKEKEADKIEIRKPRRGVGRPVIVGATKSETMAPSPAPSPSPAPEASPAPSQPPRKRGRPRKDQSAPTPSKMKKDDVEEVKAQQEDKVLEAKQEEETRKSNDLKDNPDNITRDSNKEPVTPTVTELKPASKLIMSPTGQTLKKVPIKALPPGVKPLPLPATARALAGGELCEMQIGKKLVKVQKFVMTKAEVEAMAKQGLVEMKDGTMVLKQGIKAIRPAAIGEGVAKETSQKEKSTPMRCEMEDSN